MKNQNFTLTGYEIVDRIYSGTRTVVYRGFRTSDKQPVAIKVLHSEYPSFSELVQFRNQYTIAKNLNLPGIIQTYSLEAHQNSYALIVEDFGGISLKEWREQGETVPNLSELLQMAIDISNTLDILCRHRIIHKDIKPANILINPVTKQVKLIDFSIASLLPRETQILINPNVLEGTLSYLSPEQTGRMNRGIDYRTDFYSFGVTLYELLAGELPFQSKDAMELVHCHIAKQALSLHEVNPEIPLVLSEIVAKLMAKNAEDRYQSALALKFDLELCLRQLQEHGKIAGFEIAQRDLCDRFIIPEKLYGRESEVAQLLAAFDLVAGCSQQESGKSGGCELILVAGFSGIGKTAIVNEVHKPIVRQRGYFIKGKFDQFNRNIPFSAFVQAFRDLIEQLLTESDKKLAKWQAQILQALGDNSQVIIEIIPELQKIIGRQSPALELSGTAAQNRFNLLFQNFIQVFTKAEHPLVIFLDDLQWADSASLQLIQLLMSESKTGYLLVIGAYRDNEVSPAHPFMLALDAVVKAGAKVNTITLEPLSLENLNDLVADTLNCKPDRASSLTNLVAQKTQGNPFFVTQFLKALHQDGLIEFNWEAGYWQCDIVRVRGAALTDNVVEFMALQLQKLPPATQNVLKLAACVGNQFDLNTLAIVFEQLVTEIVADLWTALQEGLILPESEIYKFYLDSEIRDDKHHSEVVNYKFLHDRVQQAAYSMIPEEQKILFHLKLGQRLLHGLTEQERETQLFDIVNHLNMGSVLYQDSAELSQLIQLNLSAGRKARSATAYDSAIGYFNHCIQLLPTDSWEVQYDLTLTIYDLAAESAYLNLDFEQMELWVAVVLDRAQVLQDKINVYLLQIEASKAQDRGLQAIATGLEILHQLGIELPQQPTPDTIGVALQAIKMQLAPLTITDLANLPTMTDPNTLAALRILARLVPILYTTQPLLFVLNVFKQIELCLQFGNSGVSAFAYITYGMVLRNICGDVDSAYEMGELALQILDRFDAKSLRSMPIFCFNALIRPWKHNLRETLDGLLKAYSISLEIGDLEHAAYAVAFYCDTAFWSGTNLFTLEGESGHFYNIVNQLKQQRLIHFVAIIWQSTLNFIGTSESLGSLRGKAFDEQLILPQLQASHSNEAIFTLYVAKLFGSYLDQDYQESLLSAAAAETYLSYAQGRIVTACFHLYKALTHLAMYLKVPPSAQTDLLEKVVAHHAQLITWANFAPMNFLHKADLIAAEKHRVLNQKSEAIDFYDRAIALANANGYIQEEALANELAAKFYLDWGKEKVAETYMQEAYYCYARWGARAKTDDLENRYPNLLRPILQQPTQPLSVLESLSTFATNTYLVNSTFHRSSSNTSINQMLDFSTMLQVSQAISGTIDLNELLQNLTKTMLQHSGGDRCALILPNLDGKWLVRAIGTPDKTDLCSESVEGNTHLPLKLIQYVKNTQKVVVIDDLKTDLPVIGDYLLQQQPKSVLCLPILNQGKLIGILYLNNLSTSGVFSSDRILLLDFLCTQAAISLENARLYQTLQQSETKFRAFVEDVNDLIYSITPDAIFSYLSPQFKEMWGHEVDEFLHQSFVPLVHPEDLMKVILSNQRLFETGEKQSGIELRTKHQNGSWFWITCNNSPIKDEQGKVIGLRGIAQNINDRKAAEIALTESEAYHRSLFEKSSIGLVLCRMDGQLIYANPALANIIGYTPEELLSLTYWQLTPEKYAKTEQQQLQSLQTTGSYGPYQKEYIHKNKSLVPVQLSGVIVERHGEQLIWSSVEDISDRKAAEIALTESEQRFRDVTEAAGEYIWEVDANGIYTYVTEKSTQVKGYTPEQLLGHRPIEFMPPEDIESARAIIANASTKGGSFVLQHRNILPNGEVVWEEVSGIPIRNHDDEIIGFRGTGLSITDRKAAETLIQQKNQELEQALREIQQVQLQMIQSEKMSALGNLVAGVAHEINNPVGCILGNVGAAQDYINDLLGIIDLYNEKFPQPGAEIEEELEAIDLEYVRSDLPKLIRAMKDGGARIKSISESLRTFSRADTDSKQKFDLHEGIESTILILRHRLKANDLRPAIKVITNYGKIPHTECFPGQLNQVFMNLLANAIDALDESNQGRSFAEIKASPNQITIRTIVTGNQIKITIADNGSGISENLTSRIFEHLFTTKNVGKGTGLGLAIARQIVVEKHGGTLEVVSTLGVGTEFAIVLPITAQS